MKRYDVVIGGYYGFDNLGDDAVLSVLVGQLRRYRPDLRIAVITGRSRRAYRNLGVDPVGRFNLFSLIHAMAGAEVFIMGGGNLFQNETSLRSLIYYTFLMKLGKLLCKSTAVYANGIGGLKGKTGYFTAAFALCSADRISVRDPDSRNLVRRMKPAIPDPVLTCDPVFMAELPDEKTAELVISLWGLAGKRYFAVSLRDTGDLPLGEIVCFCRRRAREGALPVFVSMQEKYDGKVCRAAAMASGGVFVPAGCAAELLSLLSGAELAVGMRLHFLLMAQMAGVPSVALSYNCKIDSAVPYSGGGEIIPARLATAAALDRLAERAQKNTDCEKLRRRCLELRSLALYDISSLCSGVFGQEEAAARPHVISG